MTSRREVLCTMGVGAAAVAAAVTTTLSSESLQDSMSAFAMGGQTDAAPWWVLSPLSVGSAVGWGWAIGGLSAVVEGAAVLSLVHADGRAVNVHICRRSFPSVGVAQSALFDFVAMDGRAGGESTPEDLGRVVMRVAQRVRVNEVSQGGELAPFAHLMSHAERERVFGPGRLLLGDEAVG